MGILILWAYFLTRNNYLLRDRVHNTVLTLSSDETNGRTDRRTFGQQIY